MAKREEVAAELGELGKDGAKLLKGFLAGSGGEWHAAVFGYQDWYTRALKVVALLAPDRLSEFRSYYETDPRRKNVTITNFSIQDYLSGLRPQENYAGKMPFNADEVTAARFQNQYQILLSITSRIDSVLGNLEAEIQADLLDRELTAAEELKRTSLRAAGALAGVALEAHLRSVFDSHGMKTRKKNPTIGDYNEELKKEGVVDTPVWRRIQYLADIRNLSTHKKERDPTETEIDELISGVNAVIKAVF